MANDPTKPSHIKKATKTIVKEPTPMPQEGDEDSARTLRESFETALKEAQTGDAESQYALAMRYRYGSGTEKNDELAFQWFEKAAMQGHRTSMRYIALAYQHGCGVKPDKQKADEWWKKSEVIPEKINNDPTKPSLIKKATKIIVKEPTPMPQDAQLKSHFRGQPYFENGEQWPKTKRGRKMELIFQIFNNGEIVLPPNIKLIQFYYDLNYDGGSAWDTDDDGWLVKIYENLNTQNMITIKKPKNHNSFYKKNYCEIEYETINSIPDDEEDVEWEDYQQIPDEITAEQDMHSQLGGYPKWVQGSESKKDWTFLFQIDSEDNAGLMWSDVGMVYVFYDEKNKKLEFILQCC